MALFGVIAGIHGNSEALTAVLAALERRGVRQLWCLGDIVGYNADPDECAALVRARAALALAGKDDLAGTGGLAEREYTHYSNKAMYAIRRTRRSLQPQTASWLRSLPSRQAVDHRLLLVHGGVRDFDEYMTTPRAIRHNAELLRADFPDARLCFFGHSHDRKIYSVEGETVTELPRADITPLGKETLCFVNPGAVDAQRKRASRLAECAIFDSLEWSVEFLRVPYDAASTEAKAAVFGYRINGLAEGLYTLRRKVLRIHAGRDATR
jgi:predicted phosphodiesterase